MEADCIGLIICYVAEAWDCLQGGSWEAQGQRWLWVRTRPVKMWSMLGVVVYACNPSTPEAEAGGSRLPCLPGFTYTAKYCVGEGELGSGCGRR